MFITAQKIGAITYVIIPLVASGNLLSKLWRKVMIGMPTYAYLAIVLKEWYPNLEPLIGKLIETFENVNSAALNHFMGFESVNSANSPSRFSLRDLLKWCKRIIGLGVGSMGNLLTPYQCHCIYQEGVDIFAGFSLYAENRLSIIKEIAKVWAIPISESEMLRPSKPEIQVTLTELRIGRVNLEHEKIASNVGIPGDACVLNCHSSRCVGIPGDGRCLFRSVAHGACLRAGKPAPGESLQRELADDLRARVYLFFLIVMISQENG